MKKLLVVVFMMAILTISVFAQIPIRDIQYTEDPSGDSPLKGQVVTIKGVVTAEHRGSNYANGSFSGSYYFVQDSAAAWSGIEIYSKDSLVAEGDLVTITGTVDEYYNMTEIVNVTEFIRHSTKNPLPGPIDVTTAEAATEAYEGCLVRVNDVNIVETGIGNYGEWKVDDGSGAVQITTRAQFFYTPVLNDPVKSITGIVFYSYGIYTVAPRLAWDVVEGGKYTRIQRFQQVRNSDLILAFEDAISDISYAADPVDPGDLPGDTLTIKGVVTMPSGLSYAGAGIKFIVGEVDGGPWSAVLSYHPDSTAYPTLLEGDLIEMTGYIGEYQTGDANMTEFWITSPIEIIDVGHPLPPPNKVNTGDLRLPVDAEQWGNVMVYVNDAKIVDVNPAFELFAVDDGSGSVLVDDDSDSLVQYYDTHSVPPLGTIADSIRGWVYHHYGSYADTNTYKLEPLYMSDLLWGAGPPAVSNVKRDVVLPTSDDDVNVSAEIVTNLTITEAALYFNVTSPGLKKATGSYTKVLMDDMGDSKYQGQIPKQADGSFVNYFVMATDNLNQSTFAPADTSLQNYCYPVASGDLNIMNVQYNPWSIAASPLEGLDVKVTGIVTCDTATNNNYEAYSIQDAEAPWSGIFAFGIDADLKPGDEITVFGEVTDYNADWHFKWDNNTVILTDSFKLVSSGNTVTPLDVTTGELANNSKSAESYESVLVKIRNATFVKVNTYDVSFNDGSGECLIDADFLVAADQDQNPKFYFNRTGGYMVAMGDTLYPGEKVDMIQGIFTYSFGTFKIELRGGDDFGKSVGVDANFEPVALTYKLEQNFPNPFNPETRIYFEIPQEHDVKVLIYNVLGQKVRSLVQERLHAGYHIVNWDGRNDNGQIVPSGIYLYRIKAGSFIAHKKMLLLK